MLLSKTTRQSKISLYVNGKLTSYYYSNYVKVEKKILWLEVGSINL